MKSKIAALLLALLPLLAVASGPGDNLENACAITATEALTRLSHSVHWVRMMEIHYLSIDEDSAAPFSIKGHVLTVWQPYDKGPVMVYDRSGTIVTQVHSQKIEDIIKGLNEINPSQPILSAKFVE